MGQTKRFASMLCALASFSLVAVACGDSDTTTTDESVSDTSVDVPSNDTAVSVDTTERQRNVQGTGWGTDGSGVAVSNLTPDFMSTTGVRVFRRVHIDTTGAMRVVSTQDAFVTALTMVLDGNTRTTRMQIHGFVTRDGDVGNYAMAGFGTNGVVNVDLPDRGDLSSPIGWTVVSRETIAMLFINGNGGETTGSIEFWNMATGKLDARFGSGGRIDIVGKKFGVNALFDLGLRMVEDDGKAHLVIAGADVLADGYARDAKVIALNADGSIDTAVAKSGTLSVKAALGDDTFAAGYLMSVADPGVDNSGKAIGLATMTQMIDFDPEDGVVATALLGMMHATLPADAEGNTSMSSVIADQQFPYLQNAVLDPSGPRVAALSFSAGGGFTRYMGTRDRGAMAITGTPQLDAMSPDPLFSSSSTSMTMINGTWIAATTVPDGGSGSALVVCFDERKCKDGTTSVTRPLLTRTTNDPFIPNVMSIVADGEGVHLAVNRMGQTTGSALVSFDTNGAPSSAQPATFVAGAGQFMSIPIPGTPVVSAPTAIDKRTLVAIKSTATVPGPVGLVLLTPGGTTRDVPLMPALGQAGYMWEQGQIAFFDAKTMVVRAAVAGDDGQVKFRLQKVSLDNGSPLGSVGTTDFPSTILNGPQPGVADGGPRNLCPGPTTLVSSSGVVAIVDSMTKLIDNASNLGPTCTNAPERVRWMTVLPDGTTKSGDVANLGLGDDEYGLGFTPDATGALYSISRVNTISAKQQAPYVLLRVRKMLPTGVLDARFGVNGVVELNELKDDAFTNFFNPLITIDTAGRVYLAAVRPGGARFEVATVRLTAAGAVDRASNKSPVPAARVAQVPTREGVLARRAQLIAEIEAQSRAQAAATPAVAPIVTITGEKPVLLSVRAVEDRSFTATWGLSAAVGDTYVTATALPGGRSCTAKETTCVIRGLDASETYVVVVSRKGDPVPDANTATLAPLKPVRIMKVGRIASPTTLVRPASRGKATWKVGGKCLLNANATKFTAAARPTKCRLAVTTAKDGKTPKTTRSVVVIVTK